MELEIAKKMLRSYMPGHEKFVGEADTANRYYRKKNDILTIKREDKIEDDPLRNADNRIPSNFYKLQVNQKAAYAFTDPVLFDVGNDAANETIKKALGDAFQKKCKALCVQAANTSVGWLHYWKGENGEFKYSVLDSREIVPIWNKELEKELKAVLRTYRDIDDATGDEYFIYEFWTDEEAESFRRRIDSDGYDMLEPYCQYLTLDVDTNSETYESVYKHGLGEVPFIFFSNNDEGTSDLNDIKELIDSYDKIYSGFVNDLEDIQESIFVLTNYGGEAGTPTEILREINNTKIIQVESEGPNDKSGISTLAIEIPVEAREKLLTMTRKSIFEQGMAIDPDPQNFGNSSGVALGYLYSLLELKTGLMETEFRISFNRLVRAILRFHNLSAENIEQTWTRTSVTNDAELSDIAQKSKGIISDETIVRRHPWVDDPTKELERLEKQRKEREQQWDNIPKADGGLGDGEEE